MTLGAGAGGFKKGKKNSPSGFHQAWQARTKRKKEKREEEGGGKRRHTYFSQHRKKKRDGLQREKKL